MSFRPRNQRCEWRVLLHSHRSPSYAFPLLSTALSNQSPPRVIQSFTFLPNFVHFLMWPFVTSTQNRCLLAGSAPEAERCGLHLFCFVRPYKITTMPPTLFILLFYFFPGLRRLGLNVQIMKSYEVTKLSKGKGVPNWVKFCSYLDQGGK